jgi:two-component system, OmpR family, alkaline phosphatase synthesis response regulator PhoP
MPKILIVDDEAYIRLLLEQTLEDLEEEGVTLLTAADGEEALQTARAEQPDLIFLDVMMPRVNGFDVCRTLKREWQMADLTVVLLTAKGQAYDRQEGEEAGADHYMTKPFDPDAVEALARGVLKL